MWIGRTVVAQVFDSIHGTALEEPDGASKRSRNFREYVECLPGRGIVVTQQ